MVWLAAATDAMGALGPFDWTLRSPSPSRPDGRTLVAGDSVRLVNATQSAAVVYGAREYGINLVWASPDGANNVTFLPWPGIRGGFLRRGDRLAVRVAGGGYLMYREREYGINLGWARTPVYEWELRSGNVQPGSGDNVRVGDRVGLYNTRIHRYVVYGTRPYGINLVWLNAPLPSATPANVVLSFRLGPFGAVRTCTGNLTWRFEPISLTGTVGDSRPFTVSVSRYTVRATRTGTDPYYCLVSTRTLNVRVGRWRVSLLTTPPTTCSIDLFRGGNILNFAAGRSGCSTVALFP